jgi:hypothetical protein
VEEGEDAVTAFSLTKSQARDVAKTLHRIGRKMPKVGHCVSLHGGSEVCRDRSGYYYARSPEEAARWAREKSQYGLSGTKPKKRKKKSSCGCSG